MIKSFKNYAVNPDHIEIHACWDKTFLGWRAYLYDVEMSARCVLPLPIFCFTKWGAKRTARKLLKKHFPAFRCYKSGEEIHSVYAGGPGNLVGAVRRVNVGYILEFNNKKKWVPFCWLGLMIVKWRTKC